MYQARIYIPKNLVCTTLKICIRNSQLFIIHHCVSCFIKLYIESGLKSNYFWKEKGIKNVRPCFIQLIGYTNLQTNRKTNGLPLT